MRENVIYVSSKGFDYWNGLLESPNENLSDGPICSLSHAFRLIREEHKRGNTGDFTIKLDGEFRLPSALKIPKFNYNVTVMPYDNKTATINGGRVINGFKETTVNGVKALVTHIAGVAEGKVTFDELYVNKKPAQKTVYPETGEKLTIKDLPEGLSETWEIGNQIIVFNKEDVENFKSIKNAEISVLHYWVDEHMPIIKYSEETATAVCTVPSRYPLRDDVAGGFAKYRLINLFEMLKKQGQWYLDKEKGLLYYIPRAGETADNILVEIPVARQLLDIDGSNITFKNITFENARSYTPDLGEFDNTVNGVKSHSATYGQGAPGLGGAVKLNAVEGVKFIGCTFRNSGGYALDFLYGSKYNLVENCEIYQNGGGGVKFIGSGYGSDLATQTAFNRVIGNKIHNNSLNFKTAIGVFGTHTYSNLIADNEISYMEYSGISLGWVWGYGESNSGNNVIENNHIHHLGSGDMSDMGGVYLLGSQAGTVVRNNRIHDIVKANYGGWGIYLDEGSAYVLVEGNVVYRCATAPFVIHYGRENTVRYNIFAFGDLACAGITRGAHYTQATFTKNVFITDNKPIFECGYNFRFGKDEVHSSGNFFLDIGGNKIRNSYIEQQGDDDRIATFEYWQSTFHDNDACFDGVILKDKENVELDENSLCFKMGFPKPKI